MRLFLWFSNTLSHYNFHPLFSRDLHSQEKVEEGVHLVCDARVSLMKVRQEEDSLSSIHWNKWTCESDFPISLESLVHWCAQKSINGIVLISTTIPRYVTLVVVDHPVDYYEAEMEWFMGKSILDLLVYPTKQTIKLFYYLTPKIHYYWINFHNKTIFEIHPPHFDLFWGWILKKKMALMDYRLF